MTRQRVFLAIALCGLFAFSQVMPSDAAQVDPSDIWLDDGFGLRFVIFVNETDGVDKGDVLVDVWLDLTDLGVLDIENEMRVAYFDADGGKELEIPFQVAGARSDGVTSYEARVIFEADPMPAGCSRRYHVYTRSEGAARSPLFTEYRPDLIKNRIALPSYENNNYDFSGPTDVDVSPDGRIFVVDRGNHRVQIFDANGSYLHTLGKSMTEGSTNTTFSFPTGIAVTANQVLVGDTGNHRVQVFNDRLEYVSTIGETGVAGTDASHLNGPKDLTVDGSGKVYVADFGNHRVQVFDWSGAPSASMTIGSTGVPGTGDYSLRCPYSVAVRQGRIFVSDSSNHRIQVYGLDGAFQTTLGIPGVIGSGQGEFYYPYGISATCDGCLAVADFKNHRVQIFNATLSWEASVGVALTPGSGNSLLHDPSGVKLEGDRLFVADTHNNRVQVFSAAGAFIRTIGLRPRSMDDETRFYDPRDVTIAEDGTVFVADRSNHRVQVFSQDLDYLFTIGTAGESGSENTHLNLPYDVDVTSSLIAVADSGNNRVQFFTRDGVYVATLAGGGGESFLNPCGVKVDEAGGRIFVADTYHDRVFVFNDDFTFIRIISGGDPRFTAVYGVGSPTFKHPYDIEMGPGGDLYVLDTDNLCVQVLNGTDFSHERTLFEGVSWDPAASDWVGGGQAYNQLQWACGFDIRGSTMYVADTYNHRMLAVGLDGAFLFSLGAQSGLDNRFVSPRGVGVGPSGDIFVADSNNNRIQIFDSSGVFVAIHGTSDMFEYDADHFYGPEGVCVLSDGSFLVADTNNHRVTKYGRLGLYQFTIGGETSRELGSDNEHLNTPTDVAVGNGRIYVADKGNSRVQVFHMSGEYDKTLYFDCYGLTVAPNGRLYLADAPAHCVRVVSADGTLLATLGTPSVSGSDATHLNFPNDVFVDEGGRVYVADRMNHRIAIYDDLSDNVIDAAIGVAGSPGQDSSRLNDPHDVVVSDGLVYVADSNNHRIQVFNSNGLYLDTIGVTGKASRTNTNFNTPRGIAVDAYGALHVADTSNHRVVRVYDVSVEVAGIEEYSAPPAGNDQSSWLLVFMFLAIAVLLAAVIAVAFLIRKRGGGEPDLPRGWGVIFVSKSGSAKDAYKTLERLRKVDGMKALLVSRAAPHQLEESYGADVNGMVWLSRIESDRTGVRSLSPRPLPQLLDLITTFLVENKGDVVMLDGIELLITENDFDSVLKFLDSLVPLVSRQKAILIMPVDADAMSKREFTLLTKGMHVMD